MVPDFSELAAAERQDEAVGRGGLGVIGEIVAAGLGAVAAADDEEPADLAVLHRLDHRVGDPQNRVATKADRDRLLGSVPGEAW